MDSSEGGMMNVDVVRSVEYDFYSPFYFSSIFFVHVKNIVNFGSRQTESPTKKENIHCKKNNCMN
jgi:hypothetical protein